MLSLRLAVVSAVLLSVAACGGGYSSPPTAPSPPPAPSPSAAPSGAPSSVTIPVGAELLGARAFTPSALEVQVGTTVTWMNADRDSHTTTSDAPAWNSGTISPGQQFSFRFQAAGTFPYHCGFHPGMTGTVVVR